MAEEADGETGGDQVDQTDICNDSHGLDTLQLSASGKLVAPDTGRVIIHFDIDCFYAQVSHLCTKNCLSCDSGSCMDCWAS